MHLELFTSPSVENFSSISLSSALADGRGEGEGCCPSAFPSTKTFPPLQIRLVFIASRCYKINQYFTKRADNGLMSFEFISILYNLFQRNK
ncbi:MAG TPA: hypothetical protein DHU69_01455 [Deltaproteobacteria bacterium]|nr:MAG: hypothetical protein A2235_07110 [Deltaproteobacteria bacterium RIFOXYA2_FULL_42_10]HAG51765.1 hypothetical protein [Deltaproteobacteria bacterium]HCY18438.1 hypothetical protein [Deltaproteobacteria bacterium]